MKFAKIVIFPRKRIFVDISMHPLFYIVEISCKRAKLRMPFCSTDKEISLKISFGKAKSRATVYLGSEISWNISFVEVEIKLNVDEINKSCA